MKDLGSCFHCAYPSEAPFSTSTYHFHVKIPKQLSVTCVIGFWKGMVLKLFQPWSLTLTGDIGTFKTDEQQVKYKLYKLGEVFYYARIRKHGKQFTWPEKCIKTTSKYK